MLFACFHLENIAVTLFGPLLAIIGNPQCWKSLFGHPVFRTTRELCLPVLNFPLTWGDLLVLNIPIWSIDSYSSTVVTMRQFAPSVLSWLVWWCKVPTIFSHNFAWGHFCLYLPRWNQTYSGIPEPKQILCF